MKRVLWWLVEAFPYVFVLGVIGAMVTIFVAGAAGDVSGAGLVFGGALVALVAVVGYGFMREWWDERP